MYVSIEELVSDATSKNLPISELVIQAECKDMNVSRNDVWRKMKHNLDTMRLAVSRGAHGIGVYSKTGLTGGDAVKIKDYRKSRKTLSGDMIMSAVQSLLLQMKLMQQWELCVRLQQPDLQVLFQECYLLLKRGWN